MKVFDAQINIGKALAYGPMQPVCDLAEYDSNVGPEVIKGLVIPVANHEIRIDGILQKSCYWWVENGTVKYKAVTKRDDEPEVEILYPKNPYAASNLYFLSQIAAFNVNSTRDYFFIPMIHPILDDESALEGILENPLVRAFKIHGIGSASSPKDVPGWLIATSKKKDLPFYVHTDAYPSDENAASPDFYHQLYNKNSPINWYRWAQEKGVRIFLAHGARGNAQFLKYVGKNPNVLFGSGPDYLINVERERTYLGEGEDYLTVLLRNSTPSNIAFCIDYKWNIRQRGIWEDMDWGSIDRTIDVARKVGLSESNIEKIMYSNAAEFFKG